MNPGHFRKYEKEIFLPPPPQPQNGSSVHPARRLMISCRGAFLREYSKLFNTEIENEWSNIFFSGKLRPSSVHDLIHEVSRSYSIRHTSVGRTPLDEWSARRRDLYLTTYNTHNRQISMSPCGFRNHNLSRRRLRPRGHSDKSLH